MRSSPNAGISPAEAVPDSDEAAAEDTSDLEESAGVGDVAEDVPRVEQAVRRSVKANNMAQSFGFILGLLNLPDTHTHTLCTGGTAFRQSLLG